MKNVYFTLIISLFVILISCEKEIEFKGDSVQDLIVVNGVLEKDSVIQISLSVTKPSMGPDYFGQNQYLKSPANLILTDNTTGETFMSTMNSLSYYSFGTTAKSDHSYSINISHPDYLTASATTSIPQGVSIIDWDTSTINVSDYSSEKKLNLSWMDTGEENFYFVELFSIDTVYNQKNLLYIYSYKINEGTMNDGSSMLILKDDLFNNSLCQLSIKFNPDYYYDQNWVKLDEKSYKVVLHKVSKEVYNYYKSVSKINIGPFSEPVKVYTNILNGLGVFGGKSSTTLFFE